MGVLGLSNGLAGWMLNNNNDDEIDWGTASPRPKITPGDGASGGWPTNPRGGVIGRGGKQVPVGKPKPGKKPGKTWSNDGSSKYAV